MILLLLLLAEDDNSTCYSFIMWVGKETLLTVAYLLTSSFLRDAICLFANSVRAVAIIVCIAESWSSSFSFFACIGESATLSKS